MRRFLAVGAGALAMLVGATPAGAAQIGIRPADSGPAPGGPARAVYMVAAPGERNDVTVRATGPLPLVSLPTVYYSDVAALTVTVTDPNATFEATPPADNLPCEIVDAHTARCPAPADQYFMQAVIDLGDGDDRLRFAPDSVPLREQFFGGEGNDDIVTGPFVGDTHWRWQSDTGPGNDKVEIDPSVSELMEYERMQLGLALVTGTGEDTVSSVNGAYDQVECGDGRDTLFADKWDDEYTYSVPKHECETRIP